MSEYVVCNQHWLDVCAVIKINRVQVNIGLGLKLKLTVAYRNPCLTIMTGAKVLVITE